MVGTSERAWYRRKRLYAVLLLLVLLVLYFDRALLGKWMYPLQYEALIVEQSQAYDVDPYLIASIIRVESNFRPTKTSPKGAIGLMQLMPPTAEWIAKQEGDEPAGPERLQEADRNIRYGTWYVRSLQQQFASDGEAKRDAIARVAAAYNAGPGNVERWLSEGRWDGTLDRADDIPFGETRHYVHRVYYYYVKYEQTYPELAPNP
ncbi:lytic transglycosylase domain-containing protein [Paenibacillus antri]|uniref:Lytic transglycosylase domain-containing protein n=1 Tax=Paenibacillus antri TaxID=2582848 RepID=A0A5R9FY57_9BACL|nr:lytic transglycosylase domain-containing protein [Paenibacillus antri]TLS48421.1 lytic transglycosylase domain-containing protein [Paenibacillus antri]